MSNGNLGTAIRWVQRTAAAGDTVADAELLDRFVAAGDEAAFELMLWRHQRLVFGVCRRVLHDQHDSEDAFQATFLVLARKGHTIGRRQSVASWLYKVAYRCALSARAARLRRIHRERPLATADEPVAAAVADGAAQRELCAVLDEEVSRLPARFREPTVLCYLAGLSVDEAAAQLGCPRGTVASRLARARERLRGQLQRRGLVLPAALAALTLGETAQAKLPGEALLHAVLMNVKLQAAGQAVAAKAAAGLAAKVVQTMLLRKLLLETISLVALVGLLFFGGGLALQALAQQQSGGAGAPPANPHAAVPQPPDKKPATVDFAGRLEPSQTIQVRARVSGIVDKVAVQVGDKVKKDSLLFHLDSRTATTGLESARANLAQAEAKAKIAAIAAERLKRLLANAVVSREEYEQYLAEAAVANATLQLARAKLEQAQLQVEFTRVTAPLDAQVSTLRLAVGDLVTSADNAPAPVTLMVVDPIALRFDMDERTFARYQQLKSAGKVQGIAIRCAVAARDEKGFPHEAKLRTIANRVDPATGTIAVVATLPNPDGELLPGMFMRVRVNFLTRP